MKNLIQAYKGYLTEENMKYREAAINHQLANIVNSEYAVTQEILHTAISNTAALTGLIVPEHPEDLSNPTCPIKLIEDAVPALVFSGYQERHNDVTAKAMGRILTREMRRIAGRYNIPMLYRVVVMFSDNHYVAFAVMAEADIAAYKAPKERPEIIL